MVCYILLPNLVWCLEPCTLCLKAPSTKAIQLLSWSAGPLLSSSVLEANKYVIWHGRIWQVWMSAITFPYGSVHKVVEDQNAFGLVKFVEPIPYRCLLCMLDRLQHIQPNKMSYAKIIIDIQSDKRHMIKLAENGEYSLIAKEKDS